MAATRWQTHYPQLMLQNSLSQNQIWASKTNPPTPQKFNMEPENDGFQKESPFPVVDFQVPC